MKEVAKRSRGRVIGVVDPSEDRAALEHALFAARELVLSGEAPLLLHGEHRPELSAAEKSQKLAERLAAVREGRSKRMVFRLETASGPRIVKIAAPMSAGNTLQGLFGSSPARREHRDHKHAEGLGLAASRTLGFLEWRSALRLLRCAQLQTPIPEDLPDLRSFLGGEIQCHGEAALDPLAAALADTHGRGFFHSDLKPFHVFVSEVNRSQTGPATFRLRFLDLGRVSFRMSSRKRVINLYQTLRFVLPATESAQERFIRAYCHASGWHRDRPERALAIVRRFLEHKLETHPHPQL